MYKVYCITNLVNNVKYIGFTSQTIKIRFEQHTNRKNCIKLRNALNKYGKENFIIELIKNFEDRDEALDYENKIIKELNTLHPFGYNLTEGGRSPKMSDETKLKMSKSHIGIKKGQVLSQETKNKMSQTRIERKLRPSKESIIKGLNTRKLNNKPLPANFGKNISERQRGANNPSAKSIVCDQTGKIYASLVEAAADLNIKSAGITQVLKGRNKTVGKAKLTFSYKEEICN